MAEKKEKSAAQPKERVYTREQILHASRYVGDKDILDVMLEEGKTYTQRQIQENIARFKERRVN